MRDEKSINTTLIYNFFPQKGVLSLKLYNLFKLLLLATKIVKTFKTSVKKIVDDEIKPAEDLELEIGMVDLEGLQKLIKKGYRFNSIDQDGTIALAK